MTGEERTRHVLDNWKFWIGVAYVGLAATVVALFVLFSRTAHEEAVRVSQQRTARQAQVTSCVSSARAAPAIQAILTAIESLAKNSIIASDQALAVESSGDPLRPIRLASRRRAIRARDSVRSFRQRFVAGTPTLKRCATLARQLHVDVPKSP